MYEVHMVMLSGLPYLNWPSWRRNQSI